jgi:hypothetical protein
MGGIALSRLAIRMARDVQPLEPQPAPVAAGAPVARPYVSALGGPSPDVSSGAITRPAFGNVTPPEAAPEDGSFWRNSFRQEKAPQ